MARSQIRRTGENGSGLALTGLILGWLAIIMFVLVVAVIGVAAVSMGHTVMYGHAGMAHTGPFLQHLRGPG
jgi:hypothetical protein